MTVEGAQALREELEYSKSVARPRIVAAISEARQHGDLKENGEYHAAKEQQSFLEGRILEIEAKLAQALIINVHKIPHDGRVVFGVTVCFEHARTGEVTRYQIVGDDEADFKKGKISINSPIARAALGKQVDESFEVHAPGGVTEYVITAIEYI